MGGAGYRQPRAPVGVIAHSFGGGQGVGLAGVFPELVRWLVIIDGLGPPPIAFVMPDDVRASVRSNGAPAAD